MLSPAIGLHHAPQTTPLSSQHARSFLAGESKDIPETTKTSADNITVAADREKHFYNKGIEAGTATPASNENASEPTSKWKTAMWVTLVLAGGAGLGWWYQARKDKPKLDQLTQLQAQQAANQ